MNGENEGILMLMLMLTIDRKYLLIGRPCESAKNLLRNSKSSKFAIQHFIDESKI